MRSPVVIEPASLFIRETTVGSSVLVQLLTISEYFIYPYLQGFGIVFRHLQQYQMLELSPCRLLKHILVIKIFLFACFSSLAKVTWSHFLRNAPDYKIKTMVLNGLNCWLSINYFSDCFSDWNFNKPIKNISLGSHFHSDFSSGESEANFFFYLIYLLLLTSNTEWNMLINFYDGKLWNMRRKSEKTRQQLLSIMHICHRLRARNTGRNFGTKKKNGGKGFAKYRKEKENN